MHFLKGLFTISSVVGSLCFLGPGSDLHNLIQVRGAFSGLRRTVSRELLDAPNILTIATNINHLQPSDPFVFTLFGVIYWFWIRPDIDKDDKIQDMVPFRQIQRAIYLFTMVFFNVVMKNAEIAV
jgi:hypothetical protein